MARAVCSGRQISDMATFETIKVPLERPCRKRRKTDSQKLLLQSTRGQRDQTKLNSRAQIVRCGTTWSGVWVQHARSTTHEKPKRTLLIATAIIPMRSGSVRPYLSANRPHGIPDSIEPNMDADERYPAYSPGSRASSTMPRSSTMYGTIGKT